MASSQRASSSCWSDDNCARVASRTGARTIGVEGSGSCANDGAAVKQSEASAIAAVREVRMGPAPEWVSRAPIILPRAALVKGSGDYAFGWALR
jgi:hypothetical protein